MMYNLCHIIYYVVCCSSVSTREIELANFANLSQHAVDLNFVILLL